ncbi:MAG: DUF3530 family protein [Pseudomonadales bacterium]
MLHFLTILFQSLLTTALLTSLALAQDDATTTETAVATEAAKRLDSNTDDQGKVWLTVAGQRELAFYLSETSGIAHGGVLLIPDLGHHPNTTGIIDSLRHHLAKQHWHTLALDTADATEERTLQMIAAGILSLNQHGVFNIAILGEGVGAALALHYVATLPAIDKNQDEFEQIRALIMINARNSIPGSSKNTLKKLTTIRQPILDAYINSDYLQQQQAKIRKTVVGRKTGDFYYQQIRLPKVSYYQQGEDNRITQRIRGWLDKNVAGFMVDRK